MDAKETSPAPTHYHAHDLDQLSEFLRAFGWRVKFDRTSRACNYESDSLLIGGAVVMRFNIETALSASTAGVDDVFIFHITDCGMFAFDVNRQQLCAGPGQAIVVPVRSAQSGANASCSRGMGIALSREILMSTLRNHFELQTPRDLQFKASLFEETQVIAGLKALGEALLLSKTLTRTGVSLTKCIASYMLEAIPNNYWEHMRDAHPHLAPPTLLKAKKLIEDSLLDNLTIADIARLVGVSIRALQYSFTHHCEMTPVRYQQLMRLKHACEELKTASDHLSTAQIAKKWGFANLGRFSRRVYEVYGCRPRDLRQKKNSS